MLKETQKNIIITLLIITDIGNLLWLKNDTIFYTLTAVYAIDYLYNVIKLKKEYIFKFSGIIDILVILISCFLYPKAIVVVIRMLNILKITRKNLLLRWLVRFFGVEKIYHSIIRNAKELMFFIKMIILIFVFSGVIIYFLEHDAQPENFQTIWDGYWWAFTTMTTVGYGDLIPVTVLGKIFSVFVTTLSLGVVVIPSTIIAADLTKNPQDNEYKSRLKELKDIYEKDLITEEEYNQKRKEILKEI